MNVPESGTFFLYIDGRQTDLAVTKLMHMKEAPAVPHRHLANAVKYILDEKNNEAKTCDGLYVGGNAGYDSEDIIKTFLDTKELYGKMHGRQGYHFVISFEPGETDADEAYKITKEFAKKFLGENYDYVFATHTDKKHIHSHLIFNSVSRTDGYKYRYENGDWERYIQPVTDEICMEHGLKPLKFEENMRYLQAGRLKELGFENFDAWASTFGETQTAIELAPEGTGYRAKTRFAKFFNLPELISLFKESADIQTADMLKLPVPECDYENVVLKPSVFQQDIVKSLGDRAENIRKGGVDSSIDNMLKVTSDGRKCAIDQRLINPDLPDNENSKVNACAARAYDIWKETAEDKSTQLIFCDASTPRSDGGFDVYHAIKDKLIAKGVPDKEIAFIHDANTKKQKAELFSKVRSGQVRFLLGSTAKMGAGTNVQTRLIALHHIDVPWRPSDIEQQEGRILRQGNRNERVKIFRYVTENTFDSYSWQLIENKQKFIGQIMTSKSPVRSCDDVDEAALSYAEVKALATGNPYIKEKMTLDTEVAKLKLLKANFKSQKYRLEDAINKEYPVRIAKLEEKIEGLRQDIITRGPEEILSDGFEIRINGVPYDDKKEGGAALIAAAKESKTPERTMIGDYKGFKLYSRFDAFFNLYYIHMQGRCEHTIEMSSDPAGMITRLNNCMAGFEKRLSDVQDALDETRIELETAEKEVTKKFDKEDILSEKLKRLSFLNAQLDADRKETPQNAPQNTQAQRNDIKEKYINI